MNALLDAISQDLTVLSASDQARVAEYIAFLRWRAGEDPRGLRRLEGAGRPWHYNFLEQFSEADVRASKAPAGMEVKAAEASVGGERRPALWMHPPVSGEALVEYHVPVPAGLRDLRLRFALGIRDGARAGDRLVAFRVRVDGWQVWTRAALPDAWTAFDVSLPYQAGNILRIAFATDGLGDHQYAWAVWGEPMLVGSEGEG